MSMEPMIARQEASTMSVLVHFLDSCNSSFSSKKPFVFGRPLDPTSIVVGMLACMQMNVGFA